jgi:hypothetical protein
MLAWPSSLTERATHNGSRNETSLDVVLCAGMSPRHVSATWLVYSFVCVHPEKSKSAVNTSRRSCAECAINLGDCAFFLFDLIVDLAGGSQPQVGLAAL